MLRTWLVGTMTSSSPLVLAYCEHDNELHGERLSTYLGHCQGLSYVEDGYHVLEWGGGYTDYDAYDNPIHIPDWWFQYGSQFEVVARPTKIIQEARLLGEDEVLEHGDMVNEDGLAWRPLGKDWYGKTLKYMRKDTGREYDICRF